MLFETVQLSLKIEVESSNIEINSVTFTLSIVELE